MLGQDRFFVLEDDLGLQPADAVVPVIRTAILDRYGDDLRRLIDGISSELHTPDLIQLNRRVDTGPETAAEVAADFLEQNGLLPDPSDP